MYEDITITTELRREMTEHVIPAAMEFSRDISGFALYEDIDCMDGIRVEDQFEDGEFAGAYSLTYKAGEGEGQIICSFLTYPAEEMWEIMRMVLDAEGLSHVTIVPHEYNLEPGDMNPLIDRTKWTAAYTFKVSKNLRYSFRFAHNVIIKAAKKCFCAYKLYENVVNLESMYLSTYEYSFYEYPPDSFETDRNPYGVLFVPSAFTEQFKRRTEENSVAVEKRFATGSADIVDTSVLVRTSKAADAATDIICETIAEEDIRGFDRYDYECLQSFTLSNVNGKSRSIKHNGDVIARLYYVRPDVYVLKPLDLYLEEPVNAWGKSEKLKHLIVIREGDGGYSFFAETFTTEAENGDAACSVNHRLVAFSGLSTDKDIYYMQDIYDSQDIYDRPKKDNKEDNRTDNKKEYKTDYKTDYKKEYKISIIYRLMRFLPFVAAIEDWAFEPQTGTGEDIYQVSEQEKKEEEQFRKLNEDGRKLAKVVKCWVESRPADRLEKQYTLGGYDEAGNSECIEQELSYEESSEIIIRDFLYSPATRVLKLLRENRPDLIQAYQKDRDEELLRTIYFVQDIKNRTYGVDSDKGLKTIERKINSLNQISLQDLMQDIC